MAVAIELAGVGVRYGRQWALQGVDLRVEAGERVALVGPSGAGKSTLLGLVNGLVRAETGSVVVLGRALGSTTGAELRRLRTRIGTVHQHLDLVGPLRVVHNVNAGRLGRWSLAGAAASLVRPAGVDEVRGALDRLGVADKLWARTDRLSGGERQRVALARVLVQGPDIVLADEPVASLDPPRADAVVGLLTAEVAGGRTLVVSLHDHELALRHCDRVVGLVEGRVAFDRPAAELRDRPGSLRALLAT
ncbi:MAG: ATP-binding cassette domain-containing protein [Acidimicrobiia bacterium]|nr:ATP-binding cassette domain-containing protein [Acidimicrobiia bacterium]